MIIIKGVKRKYLDQLIVMHMNLFHSDLAATLYDFKKAMNLKNCYLLVDEKNDKVISFVGVSDKKIIHDDKKLNVALIGCIMTRVDYRNQGHAKRLLTEASNWYLNNYDSVIIQAWNWDIYKSFDLVDTTIKHEYRLNHDSNKNIHNEYPINNLATVKIIKRIEQNTVNKSLVPVIRSSYDIKKWIEVHQFFDYEFMSYNTAYIWYKDNKIDDFYYENIDDLIVLLKAANINNEFLLFEDNINNDLLINQNKKVIVTKTFKNSKYVIDNIHIFDFVM